MRDRARDILLTIVGTLLVLGALGGVIAILFFAMFALIEPARMSGPPQRSLVWPALYLLATIACAAGAWAIRRMLRRSGAGNPPESVGFEVTPPR